MLYFATSNNLCFALPGKTGKHEHNIFHSNALLVKGAAADCVARTILKEKNVICNVSDSV